MKYRRDFLEKFYKAFLYFFIKLNFPKILESKTTESSLTKVLFHPITLNHHISINHPESPKRIEFIINNLKKNNMLNLLEEAKIQEKKKIDEWILKVHDKDHILSLKKNDSLAEKVSRTAIKTCMIGLDKIMNKQSKNVFCAVRPPGHHALNTGKEEGFCYYNHVAVLGRYAQIKYNLKKILIIDWDYHHGNSTEYFFYDDPSVLFFSTHDASAYPRTGSPMKKGYGKGLGYNINVDLKCGTSDKDIINVFKNILLPAAKKFKPNLIIISAGFDSRINDSLGCFKVTDKGFESLTEISMSIAKEYCGGKLISVLEGGYNLDGNAKASISHIKALNKF